MFQKLFVLYPTKKISGSLLISTLLGFVYPNLDFVLRMDVFFGDQRGMQNPRMLIRGPPAKPLLHTIAPSYGRFVSPTQGMFFFCVFAGLKTNCILLADQEKGCTLNTTKKQKKLDTCNFFLGLNNIFPGYLL